MVGTEEWEVDPHIPCLPNTFLTQTLLFMCSYSFLPRYVLSIRESLSSSETGNSSHKGHVKEEGQGQEQDRKQTSLLRFFDFEDEVASRDVDFHSLTKLHFLVYQ